MNKLLLLFAACIAGVIPVNAQTAKGNLFIGADVGTASYSFGTYTFNYSTNNNKNQALKNYAITLSPAFGFFLTNHFVLGGNFNADLANNSSSFVSSNNIIVTTKVISKNTTFSVGPFARYYFFTRKHSYTDANTLFFLQLATGLGSGSGNTYETNYNQNNSYSVASGYTKGLFLYRVQFNLGISIFISEDVGIDVGAGYIYNYQNYTANSNTVTTSASGMVQTNPISYKASSPESGINLSAGIHLFIRP